MSQTRRIVAIMFTDIANFTELTSKNEDFAFNIVEKQRKVLKPIVEKYDGVWVKEIGDGLLLYFPSSKQAVTCAIKIQKRVIHIENLNIRIGIHQGDILLSDNDIMGDSVNIASRIEPFSAIGGIAISHKVQEDISSTADIKT